MTEIIEYKNSKGEIRRGLLVAENNKTSIIKPHIWIKSELIKIHKIKNCFKKIGLTTHNVFF